MCKNRSVLQLHGVSVARPRFWRLEGCNLELFLVGSESNVGHRQPQAEGLVGPSVAWCFGVVRPKFWTLEGCNLELVSCRFRKQR